MFVGGNFAGGFRFRESFKLFLDDVAQESFFCPGRLRHSEALGLIAVVDETENQIVFSLGRLLALSCLEGGELDSFSAPAEIAVFCGKAAFGGRRSRPPEGSSGTVLPLLSSHRAFLFQKGKFHSGGMGSRKLGLRRREHAPVSHLSHSPKQGDGDGIVFFRQDLVLIEAEVCCEKAALPHPP